MYKVCSVCIVITLLLSVSAFGTGNIQMGGLGQTQGFQIYGSNPVSVIGGSGSATGGNLASVEHDQSLMKSFSAALTESEKSMLIQSADAAGKCGKLCVQQQGTAIGSQSQLLSNLGWKNMAGQGQSLDVGIQETIKKMSGTGSAEGAQSSLSEQSQSIIGGGSIMNASQSVGAIQTASVTGSKWTDALASNTINVIAEQMQTSN